MTSPIPQDAAGRRTPAAGLSAAARPVRIRDRAAPPATAGFNPPVVAGLDVPGGAATGHREVNQGCLHPPGLQAIAKAMSEDDLENWLRGVLKDLGLKHAYHPWKYHAKRAKEGYPDWTIAGPGGVLFRELKRQSENPTEAQDEWLCMLTDGGADADVWRPSDRLSGRIVRELAVIAGISPATRPREGDFGGPVTGARGGPG